jgi:hypothetical protein
MYDNYIYFSLERKTNKKHQQSQVLEGARASETKKVQIFGKLEEHFFSFIFTFSSSASKVNIC